MVIRWELRYTYVSSHYDLATSHLASLGLQPNSTILIAKGIGYDDGD